MNTGNPGVSLLSQCQNRSVRKGAKTGTLFWGEASKSGTRGTVQKWSTEVRGRRDKVIQKWSKKFRDILVLVFNMFLRPPYSAKAKAKAQQFTRKKPNLMKKADQLARLCHADVALIIRRNRRYYTYRSTDHEWWPPSMTEIVRMNPMYRPLS